ncbi:receptor-type tyrosine-protein phosphatase H-like isoform X2 [Pomacea canaliculata]|uniref:receptor-type tyrosine-protein phosphatase H-like isoform X2 n=1 Tax=Pomacea canaliculata TaxID=400727 RepID=UPI000D73FF9A|nr:receptor-type tyrosine-protein phosphatase H-like isoform X2 [Pomacea canaliculata]
MEYTRCASPSLRLLLTQVVAVCILSSPVIFASTTNSVEPTTSATTASPSVTSTISTTIQTSSSSDGTTPTDSPTTAVSSPTTKSATTGNVTATDRFTTDSSTTGSSSTTTTSSTTSSSTTTGSPTTTVSSNTSSSITTVSSATSSSTTTSSPITTDSSITNSSTTADSNTSSPNATYIYTTGSSITGSTNATYSSTTGSSTAGVTTSSPSASTAKASTTTSSSTTRTSSIPSTSTKSTTTTTQTSTASSKSNTQDNDRGGIIAAVVILVIAIIIAVALFVVFWKRRNQQWCKARTRYRSTKLPRKRMKMKYFAQYLALLHKDSGLLFQEQFEELQKNSPRTYSFDAALADENKIKNRYVNIVPYDHTRVKLTVDSEVGGSDFINASYVPGYSSPREYIATQGPLASTADDFWRMIWEQKSGVIVMLSDLQEKGRRKVDKYWPDEANSPERFGDITVELTSVTTCRNYTIRHFKISEDTQEERMVLQFFIPGWEDHGANLSPDDFLGFIQAVRLEARTREGPITVHCSAGVGRTGTFIALDFLMQFAEENNIDEEVDIYNLVLNMRHSRPSMVQSEKQYIFIHDVLKIIIDRKMKTLAGSNGVHDDSSAVVNLAFAASSQDPDDEADGEAAELCSTKATSL